MPLYSTSLPAGWTQNDVTYVASQQGLTFIGASLTDGDVYLNCLDAQDDAAVSAWQAACVGSPPASPWRALTSIVDGVRWLSALVSIPSTATTLDQLRTDVNNKSAAIAGALDAMADFLEGTP